MSSGEKRRWEIPLRSASTRVFIPIARKTLNEQGTPDIRIATVTNFPHGNDDIDIALAETRAAIAYGADEVDVVFPVPRADRG